MSAATKIGQSRGEGAVTTGTETCPHTHERALPASRRRTHPAAWPTETFFQKQKPMYFNREGIQIMSHAAHSDGDSIVFFRRSDVIVAGEIFDTTRFPVIDVEKGGSIQQEIDALNQIVELAIPSIPMMWQEGGTYVIPGHGWLADQADVVEYRDMVTIIRDVIADMIGKGMTLEQVQAANPTKGYRDMVRTPVHGRRICSWRPSTRAWWRKNRCVTRRQNP